MDVKVLVTLEVTIPGIDADNEEDLMTQVEDILFSKLHFPEGSIDNLDIEQLDLVN